MALTAFLERNSQIDQVSLCLDADDAGQMASRKIPAALSVDQRFAHVAVSLDPPQHGKDFNDMLLHKKALERKQTSGLVPPTGGEGE